MMVVRHKKFIAAGPSTGQERIMRSRRVASGLVARQVALDLLRAILVHKRSLETAVENHPGFAALAPRDRAFARNLLATTLRRLGQIDSAINGILERPLPRAAEQAHFALRLGVCQLLFLATPPHAAVATSVALAAHGGSAFKGVVNAVLRRLADEGPAVVADQDAERLNTPGWLWECWTAAYGLDTCRRVATVHLTEAPLDLSLKDPAEAQVWAERLGARILSTGTLRCTSNGPITLLPGYADGAWWVQDAAAALPARLLGDVRGRTVIDLCAAPGGKTAQLAAAGAQVIAIERSPVRGQRLAENLRRLGLIAEIVVADGLRWRPTVLADAVLLDAPCSATGTIRRHPDLPYLKSPRDLVPLTAAQSRLLDAAANMVRPGGLLVYAACSLEPEEGPVQIKRFLAKNETCARVPVRPEEVGNAHELIDDAGDLRTLPCHWAELGGLDGFYAARLRRVN